MKLIGTLVLLLFVYVHAVQAKMNVVLVLVDDLGWMDLACQGSTYYETPNIDKLAETGVRFTDGYAACAVCSPTRAAVQTGRNPARLGVTDWIRSRFQGGKIPADRKNPSNYIGGKNRRLKVPANALWMESSEITVAEALKTRGYRTCHIGKWHLGADPWYPQEQGYDENYGGCDYGQPPSYFDPFNQPKGRHVMLREGIPHLPSRKAGEYLTDREADEAVGFIKRNADKPFFLFLANYAVHTPIQARKDLTAKYEAKVRTKQKNAKYAAMVHSVDDAMGKVLDTLEELGISKHTLVIFTSDNGGLLGPTNNEPLRSGKGYAYEGGIRVPWIVRWPGVSKAGHVSSEPVTSVDVFPTIMAATGTELPADRSLDGVNLAPALKGGSLEERSLYWHFPHYRHAPGPYSIIRDGDYKLIRWWEGPNYLLFNLKDDLGEKRNLAADMPEKVQALNRKLLAQLQNIGAKLPRENEEYKPPQKQ